MYAQFDITKALFGTMRPTLEMLSSLTGIPSDLVGMSYVERDCGEEFIIYRTGMGVEGAVFEEDVITELSFRWIHDTLYCHTTHNGWRRNQRLLRVAKQKNCKNIMKLMNRTLAAKPESRG